MLTCNLQEQDRDLKSTHLTFHWLDFHAGSDTDSLMSGKFLNLSVTKGSILTSVLRNTFQKPRYSCQVLLKFKFTTLS